VCVWYSFHCHHRHKVLYLSAPTTVLRVLFVSLLFIYNETSSTFFSNNHMWYRLVSCSNRVWSGWYRGGNGSFRYASPSLWNNLSASFRQPRSSSVTTVTSSIPHLKLACSTNPSHHRSSPIHRTAHWTQPDCLHGLRTTLRCFSSSVIILVARVVLNWVLLSFWSHVNKTIIHSFLVSVHFASTAVPAPFRREYNPDLIRPNPRAARKTGRWNKIRDIVVS